MRRTIIDEALVIRDLGELVALDRASGQVHQWKFQPGWPVEPGYRLRLAVYEEAINPAPCNERLCEDARVRLRGHLLALTAPGAALADRVRGLELVRDLAEAIEDLVAARVGRALRIHCDADHDADA